jgi:hypothetical protein
VRLQENSDFTSLCVDERRELYIQNMKSLCIVRGIMQRQPSSLQFACTPRSVQTVLKLKSIPYLFIAFGTIFAEKSKQKLC